MSRSPGTFQELQQQQHQQRQQQRPGGSRSFSDGQTPTITITETISAEQLQQQQQQQQQQRPVTLQLRIQPQEQQQAGSSTTEEGQPPQDVRRVTWTEGTVDNEHAGNWKSSCCCIYHKPRQWDESDSESEEEMETDHCRGHLEHKRGGGHKGCNHPH